MALVCSLLGICSPFVGYGAAVRGNHTASVCVIGGAVCGNQGSVRVIGGSASGVATKALCASLEAALPGLSGVACLSINGVVICCLLKDFFFLFDFKDSPVRAKRILSWLFKGTAWNTLLDDLNCTGVWELCFSFICIFAVDFYQYVGSTSLG